MKILEGELENFLHAFCESNAHLTLVQYFQSCRTGVSIFKIFDQSNKLAYKIARSDGCILFFDPDEEEFGLAYQSKNEIVCAELIGELMFAIQEMDRRHGRNMNRSSTQ
ncbi:hypothetical protein AVKW3434_01080 [Acidovorax sp. SUPP3434]|uniref:hypothetical protein n=1 Tax=Acidovorax sp. SUPP3434 TaxID=2920880 RepID=UPI0023DE4C27|nr:hypothetical protein [Acidovorax sp. SUPP3434]GKS97926.1 hypothetical protein AVKW3434_01080 [Acidovorax sp. SUPP3434]